MSKKIASEFSIGLVLLTAIVVGGIIWIENKKQELESEYTSEQLSMQSQQTIQTSKQKNASNEQTCIPHYYDGEATLQGWLVNPAELQDEQLIVKLKDGDVDKLPIKSGDSSQTNSTVILVDPTGKNREELQNATEENPAELTIHGYAFLCKDLPLVSNQQATIAFKKAKS